MLLIGAGVTERSDAFQLGGLQILQQPANPTPAQDAARSGFPQCGAIMDKMTAASVGTVNYTVSSMWHTTDTNKHIFQSVIGMTGATSPADSLAALITAPTGPATCDGVSVQVIPLPIDCVAADAAIRNNGGSSLNPLRNVRVVLDANRDRILLLPGANNTCTAISVKSYFHGEP